MGNKHILPNLNKPSRVIWKFPLQITKEQSLEVPRPFKFLAIQWQGDQLMLWAEIDTTAPGQFDSKPSKLPYKIRMYGTGHEIEDWPLVVQYLATVQQGPYVWHFYEDDRHE